MKKQSILFLLMFSFPLVGLTQLVEQPPATTAGALFSSPSRFQPTSGFASFINLNRLHVQHTYQSAVMFGAGEPLTESEYINTMMYKFESPVWLRMDIGVIHDPFGTQQFGNNSYNAQIYLKNLSLDWKPTSNTTFSFGFRQGVYSPMQYFQRSGWRSNYLTDRDGELYFP